MDRYEIVPWAHQLGVIGRDLGEQDTESSARAIARHGRAERATDRERETRCRGGIGMKRDPHRARAGAGAVVTKCVEGASTTDGRDQADSFCLPLRRRALMMERPARSDMRWRKPWRLARRRWFG